MSIVGSNSTEVEVTVPEITGSVGWEVVTHLQRQPGRISWLVSSCIKETDREMMLSADEAAAEPISEFIGALYREPPHTHTPRLHGTSWREP